MQFFRYASSRYPAWQEAARDCLEGLRPLPSGATLGFIYATDYHAEYMPEIVALCREETGVPHWVGTVGVGVLSTGEEFLDEPALTMMMADIPERDFRVLPNLTSLEDLLRHGDEFSVASQPPWFGMVHGDPRNPHIAELIEHTANRTEAGFLVGGLTSSRGHHYQIADEVVEGGLSGVVFAPQVAVTTRLTQGVSPIGPRHVITQCKGNVILTLDHRPALDVLKEDIGELLSRRLEQLGGYIFVGLPTQDSDTADYLVRQLTGIDPESGFIAVGDHVDDGQPLMFCRRDNQSAVEDMQRMLESVRAGLPDEPRGAVYYSCLGRGANLFGPNSEELKMISQSLGEVPLVGFFANGEICRNRLYGWTGVLTVFT
jgi:small ligand-binding sensory domain FIST